MAYLAVVGSKAVNGVAAIHSEIIKQTIFKVGPCSLALRTASLASVQRPASWPACKLLCAPCRLPGALRWPAVHDS